MGSEPWSTMKWWYAKSNGPLCDAMWLSLSMWTRPSRDSSPQSFLLICVQNIWITGSLFNALSKNSLKASHHRLLVVVQGRVENTITTLIFHLKDKSYVLYPAVRIKDGECQYWLGEEVINLKWPTRPDTTTSLGRLQPSLNELNWVEKEKKIHAAAADCQEKNIDVE